MKLKKRQLNLLKKKILEEKSRISLNESLKEDQKIPYTLERGKDEVDQATTEYERSQMLRFQRRDRLYERKLEKTLEKIEKNEYGVCEECDCDIKFERLIARPTAQLCIACKDEAEKEEQGNYINRQSKSMGQTISLTEARL